MGWLHDDLDPEHEGWLGYRLGRDVAEPTRVRAAGEVLGAVLGAGPEVIDALVPACACGWQGVPVVLAGPCPRWDDLHEVERAHVDQGRTEWASHISRLLRDVPPGKLLDNLDDLLDRVAALVDDRPLAALVVLRQLTARADGLTRQAATTAREAGTSWEDIGRALGVSRQAAAERFSRPTRAHYRGPATITLADGTGHSGTANLRTVTSRGEVGWRGTFTPTDGSPVIIGKATIDTSDWSGHVLIQTWGFDGGPRSAVLIGQGEPPFGPGTRPAPPAS